MVSAVRGWRVVLPLALLGLAAWAAVRAAAAGASITSALSLVAELSWAQVVGLAGIWALGLCAHATVLSAALPGLSRRRALTLNLTGSAVASVLPLGGLAGAALNLTMTRSWGHSRLDFARFLVVSKSCDIVAKLFMPTVALAALMATGRLTPAIGGAWAVPAGVALAAGALLLWALCGRATPLLRLVEAASAVYSRATRRSVSWTAAVAALLAGTDHLVRRRGATLALGTAGYWLAQSTLLWCCLLAVGERPLPPVVFAGLVAERVMTLMVITPGGAGPAEAGMVAVLIALGADPTGALAGVLLYRAFVFVAGVPIGATLGVGWWAARRARVRRNPELLSHEPVA